jgi:hypothetical protein
MKPSRKNDLKKMAEAIDQPGPTKKGFPFERGMDDIKRKTVDPRDLQPADKIIATKKLEIQYANSHLSMEESTLFPWPEMT